MSLKKRNTKYIHTRGVDRFVILFLFCLVSTAVYACRTTIVVKTHTDFDALTKCVRCQGTNYRVANNVFVNFGYARVPMTEASKEPTISFLARTAKSLEWKLGM